MNSFINKLELCSKEDSIKYYVMLFAGLLIIGILANFSSIFLIEVISHDDPGLIYRHLINPERYYDYKDMQKGILHVFYHRIIPTYLTLEYLELARFFVVFAMVLTSFGWYLIINKLFKINKAVSFLVATLTLVLPYMWQIPFSINVSYPARFLFFYFFSLLFFYYYTKSENVLFFVFSIIFYYIFIKTDISVFTLPFTILIILLTIKLSKKSIAYLSVILFFTILKTIEMKIFSRKTPIDFNWEIFHTRLMNFFEATSPLYGLKAEVLSYIFVFFTIVLFFISLMDMKRGKYLQFKILILVLTWTFSNIIIFLTINPHWRDSYGYVSSFGLSLLYVYGVCSIMRLINSRVIKNFIYIFLFLSILSNIYFSNLYLLEKTSQATNVYSMIKKAFIDLNIQNQTQFLLLNVRKYQGFYGYGWFGSSGTLVAALDNKNVSGQIVPPSKYIHFIDPFEGKRNFHSYVNGFKLDNPLFIYQQIEDELIQLEYILQYKKNDEWTLYKLDKVSGKINKVTSGQGEVSYYKYVNSQDIELANIAFGGQSK